MSVCHLGLLQTSPSFASLWSFCIYSRSRGYPMSWYNSPGKEHEGRMMEDLEGRGSPTTQTPCQDKRWLLRRSYRLFAETWSHSVLHHALQAGLELVAILPSQPLRCWHDMPCSKGAGERTQQLRALALLTEDNGSVPSTYIRWHIAWWQLHFQVIWHLLLTSGSTKHVCATHVCR